MSPCEVHAGASTASESSARAPGTRPRGALWRHGDPIPVMGPQEEKESGPENPGAAASSGKNRRHQAPAIWEGDPQPWSPGAAGLGHGAENRPGSGRPFRVPATGGTEPCAAPRPPRSAPAHIKPTVFTARCRQVSPAIPGSDFPSLCSRNDEPPGPLIRATARLPDYRTGGGECVQTREETLAAPLGPNSRPQHHAQCGVMTVLSKDTASSIIYGNARTPNLLLTDPHSFHAPNYAITPPAILDTIRKTHFLFLSLSPLLMTSAFSPLDRPETLPDGAAARAPPTCPTS